MKTLMEVLFTLIFAKSYDFGPSFVISFDVESPIDSSIQDLDHGKNIGIKTRVGSRVGLKRLLEISNTYEIPFTIFSTGHTLLKECKGHKTIIKILRKNRRYNFRIGEYLWHAIDPASNYIEYPEFYYGDLIEEAIKSGVGHEIGSHSFSHVPYPLVDNKSAERDLIMSANALRFHGLELYSFAFPFNLVGKIHILTRYGIKIARVGHRSIQNILYRDGLTMVKTHITDLGINSIQRWIKIINLLIRRNTLISWYLHPITLYDDKAYKYFEEAIKYLIKREVNFLTFKKLHVLLLSG